ncbi:MAG TPA: hypothetical protein PKK19_07685, partial [Peptococcaceae bacterium]|nr:hypothetical protein [Peptococcaceae bacterium]
MQYIGKESEEKYFCELAPYHIDIMLTQKKVKKDQLQRREGRLIIYEKIKIINRCVSMCSNDDGGRLRLVE